VRNGKVKLAKYWNGSEAIGNPEYRKTLWITIPRNLLTSGRSINELLDADKDGKYPKEFQIYDFDPGYEDVISNITKLSKNYLDNSNNIFVNKVSIYENGDIVPYNAVILTTTDTKVSRKYKIVQYQNDIQGDNSYFVIENNSTSDKNLIFYPDKTEVSLGFYSPDSDDTVRTGYVKFEKINKVGNIYEARIEYFKQKLSDEPIFEGIPIYESGQKYNYFSNSSPIISLEPPKLVEYIFQVDTAIRLKLDGSSSPSANEINAIDDYPEDEASNQLYYGVSRVAKIAVDSNNIEVGEMKLTRDNSLSNFVIAGNKNTFSLKTKFIVAENANTGVPTETEYFTRRFWQQSTDARDEEEGDITWQHTTSATLDNWTLFPRTISEFCDEINAKELIIIERKSLADLEASIKDGRYSEQSFRLNETTLHNHNIIYLLEGAIIKYNPKFRNTLYSSLFSLNYYKGFSVINVLNQTETGDILLAFASKLLRENKPGFYSDLSNNENNNENNNISYISTLKTSKKSHINSDNIFQLMLMQIPGISNVSALALANEFKNMENLLNALKSANIEKFENIKLASGRKLSKKIITSLKENLV
jgi:ERCC4-type nuclease